MEKLYGKQKQLCVHKLCLGLDQTISTTADEFWFLCNRSVRMLLGNQLLCDSIYLSSADPHNCSLPQIAHCLRPIQRKDTISISRMLIRVKDHPTPSWAFRMYPTCILFKVKSWPCVTFHACSLSSKQYYRLYAWSTWNHYQTWVVMALLWKSFWLCMQPFLQLAIEADIILMSIMHIQFWKRKYYWALGTSQNSKFLCIKKLQQSHTNLFLSSILMIWWALIFRIKLQPPLSKQTKTDGKKSWLFTRLQENGIPGMSMRDWNRSNMTFGYVLLMSHDGKIEPLSQC